MRKIRYFFAFLLCFIFASGETTHAQDQETQQLKKLSQEYTLLLMVIDGCRFCKIFIPTVEQFARDYGFQVQAVGNMDPSKLPFPIVQSHKLTNDIEIQGYPALFLVDTNQKQMWLLAPGQVSLSWLKKNAVDWSHKLELLKMVEKA